MSSPPSLSRDTERFTDWFREHGRAVRGYLLGMVRRPDLADDLTQEVFSRAWAARVRYREWGCARAYLLKIADRLLCDHGRQTSGETTLGEGAWHRCEPASSGGDPAQETAGREIAAELFRALEQLTPAQRRVLLLRYYGQMSFSEIAKMTAVPLNTVLSHCRRGLEALRKRLT
jgi:RNA polymerase sigma factor (sigma-70 family)